MFPYILSDFHGLSMIFPDFNGFPTSHPIPFRASLISWLTVRCTAASRSQRCVRRWKTVATWPRTKDTTLATTKVKKGSMGTGATFTPGIWWISGLLSTNLELILGGIHPWWSSGGFINQLRTD